MTHRAFDAPLPAGPTAMSWRRTNSFEAPEATPSAADIQRLAAEPHAAIADLDRQHDRFADETVHERGRRMVVDLAGRADLLDAALVHHHHAVGDFERLFLVVGDEDRGDVDLVVQRRSQRRSSLRTLASSAPNGSSSSRMRGSIASARASAMRWRWPPDNWLG